jgi:hypothetical protein
MFSKRMREMGMKMFIYPNVDIVHWGYKDFGGNLDKFLKSREDEADQRASGDALMSAVTLPIAEPVDVPKGPMVIDEYIKLVSL